MLILNSMNMLQYQAKIYKDEDTFSVEFPDLPGCFSSGETLSDALVNARYALSLYLEEAIDPGWNIPVSREHKGKNLYWIEADHPSDNKQD
jgi:predicted RNase H-like HicB family nuclease